MTKIVATSDWHGKLPANLPEGDILCIAGDLLPVWNHERSFQSEWHKKTLVPFLDELPYKDIVFIAGNHDFLYQESHKFRANLPAKVHYLQDESLEIDGLTFHGSPWSVEFGGWAFMASEYLLRDKFDFIPKHTDVLLVHGPPYGTLDAVIYNHEHVGSKALRDILNEKDIKVLICGHIHEAYGREVLFGTDCMNVSLVNENYDAVNEPVVFDMWALKEMGD